MTEALRFPWEEGERRREVAPSAFRPRKSGKGSTRVQASKKPREAAPRRRASVSRSATLTSPLDGRVRGAGHASRESVAHDRTAGRVVNGPQRERHEPDYVLMAVALTLTAIGFLMVFSSSGTGAALEGGTVFDDVAEQLMWGLIGGLVLLVMMRVDYRYWRSFSVLGVIVSMVLLALVIGPRIPSLVEPLWVNGATRWLKIGGLPSFQPSEFAKLAVVIFLAHLLASRGTKVGSFRSGMLPFLLVVAPMAALIVVEPDLGTTGVIVLTCFAMFFVAGGSVLQILALVPIGVAGVAAVIFKTDYMQSRLDVWQDPISDPLGPGHQMYRGIHALAYGGLTGNGLGQSQSENGLYVPAGTNDFIFAIIGQEFGFIGALVVIGLFLALAWRGVRVAMAAPDTFGGLLALGITAWLTFQALINVGVVVSLIPMTGLPLPFLSKGGTSLVVVLAAVGILLSISRESETHARTSETRGADAHEDPHRGRGHRRPHLPRLGRRVPAAEPPA